MDKKACNICLKKFTKRTLNKHGGICGRCFNNENNDNNNTKRKKYQKHSRDKFGINIFQIHHLVNVKCVK
jgi:hypothetical protein